MIELGAGRGFRFASPEESGPGVAFTFNGQGVHAHAGESLAAALFAAGHRSLRTSVRNGEPRGMFCLMGSCQECVVWVDGRRALACQVAVAAGLAVHSGDGVTP